MATEPYTSPVSAEPSPPAGLKKVGVGMMILWTVLSMGFYYVLWFFPRIAAFNALNTDLRLKKSAFVFPLAAFVLGFAASIFTFVQAAQSMGAMLDSGRAVDAALLLSGGAPWLATLNMVLDVAQVVGIVVIMIETFKIRRMLQAHTPGLHLSFWGTLVGGIFYLQHQINKM